MTTVTPLSEHMEPLRGLDPRRTTRLMAILNATPDSFSDGGRLLNGASSSTSAHATATEKSDQSGSSIETTATAREEKKEEKARNIGFDGPHRRWGDTLASMAVKESGGDTKETIWDVGGQSTAPGVKEVSVAEETKRVVDTIEEISDCFGELAISVDTYRASVAEAAVKAGATIINDVSAGAMDPDMLPTMARLGVTVILMHMRGTPQTMSGLTSYPRGLIPTIAEELLERVAAAEAAGIRRWRIILDPGIGFAKTAEQNLKILQRFDELRDWPGLRGLPWLVGSSRKSFIGKITGVEKPSERTWGTAVTVAAAIQGGADVVRVHDVKEMTQVIEMSDAIWRA